jgi:hypothetical protein
MAHSAEHPITGFKMSDEDTKKIAELYANNPDLKLDYEDQLLSPQGQIKNEVYQDVRITSSRRSKDLVDQYPNSNAAWKELSPYHDEY